METTNRYEEQRQRERDQHARDAANYALEAVKANGGIVFHKPKRSWFDPLPPVGPFKAGDIVRLKKGVAPQEVLEIERKGINGGWYLRAKYVGAEGNPYGTENKFRTADDYVYHNPDGEAVTQQENGHMAQKLYQTKDGKTFGTLLAKNSAGQLVLEIKGTGAVVAFSADELDEVRPFTIGCVALGGGTPTHFEVTKGKFALGDLIVDDVGFWKVSHLDSQGQNAKPFKGRRLVTEEV